MVDIIFIASALLTPLAGTTLGAGAVFFRKRESASRLTPLLCAAAAGVMMAASFFSLLEPAAEMALARGINPALPAVSGFSGGILFFRLADFFLARREKRARKGLDRFFSLIAAVTLHNLPEGMAVGVAVAGALGDGGGARAGALALAIGIALQNIPEGAVISLPLSVTGKSKAKSFFGGFLSGVVEPVGAALTLLFTANLAPILPCVLALAAGAMVYVTATELMPGWVDKSERSAGNAAFFIGFIVMMTLDLALG
ncbi:MAG: ZIP family metal transporter [Clostridia bacterium]|nr:ZIP family metal transporter [Clostridia bacterium]